MKITHSSFFSIILIFPFLYIFPAHKTAALLETQACYTVSQVSGVGTMGVATYLMCATGSGCWAWLCLPGFLCWAYGTEGKSYISRKHGFDFVSQYLKDINDIVVDWQINGRPNIVIKDDETGESRNLEKEDLQNMINFIYFSVTPELVIHSTSKADWARLYERIEKFDNNYRQWLQDQEIVMPDFKPFRDVLDELKKKES